MFLLYNFTESLLIPTEVEIEKSRTNEVGALTGRERAREPRVPPVLPSFLHFLSLAAESQFAEREEIMGGIRSSPQGPEEETEGGEGEGEMERENAGARARPC